MVEKAEERSSELGFPIVYIYCDQAELDTLIASSILGSFVKQLLFRLDILRIPWPCLLREKLERDFRQGRKNLLPHELTNILLELLPSFDKAIFFVDGLDECAPKESDQVLHSLERLLRDRSAKLKIFVASRKEIDVGRYLSGCMHISVSEENIASDIRLYVEKAVAINIVTKGLTSTPSVIQDIKTSLIKGSQGM